MLLEFDSSTITPHQLENRLTQLFMLDSNIRGFFGLFDEYIEWLKNGKKVTTIRFCPEKIDCPQKYVLPLISTSSQTREKGPQVGWVVIAKIQFKYYRDLNANDARNDGFTSIIELRDALTMIYGKISNYSIITIYTIQFISIEEQRKIQKISPLRKIM